MVLHTLSILVVKCFIKGVSMQHLLENHSKIEMAFLVTFYFTLFFKKNFFGSLTIVYRTQQVYFFVPLNNTRGVWLFGLVIWVLDPENNQQ